MQESREQQKILWFFIGSALALTLPYICLYRILGAPTASFAILAATPFLFLGFLIWRVTRSHLLAGNWVVAAGFCLFFVSAYYTGGIEAPALSWSIAIPIVATLLCGWRSGGVWLLLVVVKISFFYWAERSGSIRFIQEYPDRDSLNTAYYVTIVGITFFTFLLALVSEYFKNRYLQRIEETNARLREALDSIKTLKGLLPMCAWCKKIRNDQGYWDKLEHYLSWHTEAEFSHGMCPECQARELKKLEQGDPPPEKNEDPPYSV